MSTKKSTIFKTLIFTFIILTAIVLITVKIYREVRQIHRLYGEVRQNWEQYNMPLPLSVPEIALRIVPGISNYSPVEEIPEEDLTTPDLILLGARREVKNGTRYDASYAVISYPGGDVSPDYGACTDVVVRAFRNAGIDLQQLIHEDMKENFHLYPQRWGLSRPDPNIDHRRVPNQMRFFEHHGIPLTLEVEENLDQWQWGDVVYWKFPDGRDHCGIISDRTRRDGVPLVIHNAGLTREEDCLLRWEITGHFRWDKGTGPLSQNAP
ncbi:MAG: DUF1287 domain-containing protein [Bacillota bacterium]